MELSRCKQLSASFPSCPTLQSVCWSTHVERRKLGAVGVEGLVVELGELLCIGEVSMGG
jgi:hypothetical protein